MSTWGPWLLAGAGLLVRWAYVRATWGMPAHPDVGSFLSPYLTLAHPFDTSPREPLFVWWFWILVKFGFTSLPALRLCTAVWYVPTVLLLFRLARRCISAPFAWAVACAYTFLPAQVQSDTLALRHLLETLGVVLLVDRLAQDSALAKTKDFLWAAGAQATLVLTRFTFLASGTGLLVLSALRARKVKPLLAALPAMVLIVFFLVNNKTHFGDPFFPMNRHSYWCANFEFMGEPGFPADQEEWQKDVYRKSLTFTQWAFQRHTPLEFVGGTLVGYWRFVWSFFRIVYFGMGLPAFLLWPLMLLHLGGLLWGGFRPEGRLLLLFLAIFLFPYSFQGHIFWAGRLFIPLVPLTWLLSGMALEEAVRWSRSKWAGRKTSP